MGNVDHRRGILAFRRNRTRSREARANHRRKIVYAERRGYCHRGAVLLRAVAVAVSFAVAIVITITVAIAITRTVAVSIAVSIAVSGIWLVLSRIRWQRVARRMRLRNTR